MGEEVKGKSVLSLDLSLKEIDGLLSDLGDLNVGVRDMLGDKREWSLKEIRRKALDSEKPRDLIKVISEIPSECEIGSEMIGLGEISIRILFARAKECLNTYEIELLGQALMRMYPDGLGLGSEPWKTMFFAIAKKFFPDNAEKIFEELEKAEKMLEEVEKDGIDKHEYISEVLGPMILSLTHNAKQIVLTQAIYNHKNFLSNIKDFYGISNLDWQEKQRLLEAGDSLLRGLSGEIFGSKYLRRAIEVYNWLRDNDIIEIGEDRQKAIEIVQEYELGRISKKAKDREIRRIAKRLKII